MVVGFSQGLARGVGVLLELFPSRWFHLEQAVESIDKRVDVRRVPPARHLQGDGFVTGVLGTFPELALEPDESVDLRLSPLLIRSDSEPFGDSEPMLAVVGVNTSLPIENRFPFLGSRFSSDSGVAVGVVYFDVRGSP
jgi:hypothetical protein